MITHKMTVFLMDVTIPVATAIVSSLAGKFISIAVIPIFSVQSRSMYTTGRTANNLNELQDFVVFCISRLSQLNMSIIKQGGKKISSGITFVR